MDKHCSHKTDIKHIIKSAEGVVNYLHIPERKSKGGEWLYKNITVNDTFIDLDNSNKLVLSKQFDGLLLFKKITSPEKP